MVVTVSRSPTNNAASSSLTVTTIKKLAPSPREGPPLLSHNTKWQQHRGVAVAGGSVASSSSPRNNNDGSSSSSSCSCSKNHDLLTRPRRVATRTTTMKTDHHHPPPTTTTTTTNLSSSPTSACVVGDVFREVPPTALGGSVSSYSAAPTTSGTSYMSHLPPNGAAAAAAVAVTAVDEWTTKSPINKVTIVPPPSADAFVIVEDLFAPPLPSPPPPLPPPPPSLPPPLPASVSSPLTKNGSRSKRMLVVDPRSGLKYELKSDDNSLKDKELYVYHRDRSLCVSSSTDANNAAPKPMVRTRPTSKNGSGGGRSGRRDKANMSLFTFWKSPPPPSKLSNSNTALPSLQ